MPKLMKYQNDTILFFAATMKFYNLSQMSRRIKFQIFHLIYTERIDYDCDGVTRTLTDRLTNGKIYSAYAWNFTSMGGSVGAIIEIFGHIVPNKDN